MTKPVAAHAAAGFSLPISCKKYRRDPKITPVSGGQ